MTDPSEFEAEVFCLKWVRLRQPQSVWVVGNNAGLIDWESLAKMWQAVGLQPKVSRIHGGLKGFDEAGGGNEFQSLKRPWMVVWETDGRGDEAGLMKSAQSKMREGDVLLIPMAVRENATREVVRGYLSMHFAEWDVAEDSAVGLVLRRTQWQRLTMEEKKPELKEWVSAVKKGRFAEVIGELDGKAGEGAAYLRGYCLWRLKRNKEAVKQLRLELGNQATHEPARRLLAQLVGDESDEVVRLETDRKSPYLLNLGCGGRFHQEWVNVDLWPISPEVLAHDFARHGVPFEDGSCAAVYHSHVLEHIPKAVVPTFLRECFRVLAVGGVLRVAVPDLERTARLYLEYLERALQGDEEAEKVHDWMVLEMVDQLSRHRPGGEMLRYWRQRPMPAHDFVVDRLGHEVRDALAWIEKEPAVEDEAEAKLPTAAEVGAFRVSGEVHLWMYDRLLLRKVMEQAGFEDVRICGAAESSIRDFASYGLDTDEAGRVRKPESLFMEGIRKR